MFVARLGQELADRGHEVCKFDWMYSVLLDRLNVILHYKSASSSALCIKVWVNSSYLNPSKSFNLI